MNDSLAQSPHHSRASPTNNRDLPGEIERLRNQVARLRNRQDWIDLRTLRTYEDMLESRLRLLEENS